MLQNDLIIPILLTSTVCFVLHTRLKEKNDGNIPLDTKGIFFKTKSKP